MSTNYPGAIDNKVKPTASTYTNGPVDAVYGDGHAALHQFDVDAIEALEAKVGANSSAVTTSHDYKLSHVTGSQVAASETYVNTVITGFTGTATASSAGTTKLSTNPAVAGNPVALNSEEVSATSGANKVVRANASGKIVAGFGGSASTIATLDASTLVVQNPANATATATASKIPIADSNAKLNTWVDDLVDFGDGSDGDVNVNSGAFTSGPITSNALTRDAYFNNLTLSGGSIDTAGFRIFVKGTLTRSSSTYKISRNGNAGGAGSVGADGNASAGGQGGAGGVAAVALASGTLEGGLAGKVGGAGGDAGGGGGAGGNGNNGTNGSAQTNSLGTSNASAGNLGGIGGSGSGGGAGVAGATVGTGGATTTATMLPRNLVNAVMLIVHTSSTAFSRLFSSASPGSGTGGGAGGGAGSNNRGGGGGGGGASGGPGGIVAVYAKKIVDNGTGNLFEALGGAGGDGGAGGAGYNAADCGGGGGGGAGAGGNGGFIILVYNSKSGTGSATASVAAGAGGAGGLGGGGHGTGANGTAGSAAVSGFAGIVYEFNLGSYT